MIKIISKSYIRLAEHNLHFLYLVFSLKLLESFSTKFSQFRLSISLKSLPLELFIKLKIFIYFCMPDLSHDNENCKLRFCEVQYKRTEQSFKINSVNVEWCKIQSCINC
ncbi:hypothetical protein BpHYR1_033522 [Brachionus plicatilis]|uniref:Uncharacterized protein n=1 Tax=Brachionus plicatilis TaxID=10195 RepID=A0A3M7SFV2_BRAPC|nr:hypothetical protein BpHYR1_033522 [Brachionus plicatilis]